MKLIATFIILTIAWAANGQDAGHPETSPHRLLFGITVSPDLCYRTLINNDGSSYSSAVMEVRQKNEEPKFGFTTGLNACFNFSEKLGIEGGLLYSNKGYAFKNAGLTFGNMIDPRYGFIYPDSGLTEPVQVTFLYNYIYLDVPVRVIYSFGEKRTHVVMSVGITTGFLLNTTQTSVIEYQNGDTNRQTRSQDTDFNTVNLSATCSAGLDYRVSTVLNIRAEPTFRYGLLRITDTPVSEYLWNAGLNITCYYALR